MRTILLLFIEGVALLFLAGCRHTALDYVSKGNDYFKAGQYEDAAIQYRKALQKDSKLGEAYYRIGLIEIERNRGNEAYAPLFRSVELMPDNDAAKARLADVTLALYAAAPQHPKALYEQVEKLADQLLARNPGSFDGLRLKGSLRLLDRKPKEAIPFFERANQVEPMRPDLMEGLVQALFQEGRFAEGEALATQTIDEHKTFTPIYDVLYRHYISTNHPSVAESLLKAKIANNPKDAASMVQLAQHYSMTENPPGMNDVLKRLAGNPQDFPDGRLQAGDFYASLRLWDQALQQFEEGAKASKDKIVYHKRMTDLLLAQRKRADAAHMVELVLKDQPKDSDARRIRATLLMETGSPEDISKGAADLQALIKDRPDDSRLRFQMGRAYLLQGNADAARLEFQQVLRLRSDDLPSRFALAAISLNQRKPAEALEYLEQILAADAENQAAKLLRVSARIGLGQYMEARTELDSLLRRDPMSWNLRFESGILAIAERRFSQAEKIFRKLNRKLDEDDKYDPRPTQALVDTYTATNQFERALGLVSEQLKKAPESPELHRLLALTASQAGKYDLAVTEYQWLIGKDSKSIEARLGLAEVCRLKGDSSGAIAHLEQACRLEPKNPEPMMFLAAMLGSAGRSEEAKTLYERVLEIRPDNPFVLNNMAFLLADSGGNLDEALRLAQRALQKAPGNPTLTDTLGWVYLKKGMTDSAVQTLSNAVRQQPQNSTFRYHLGMALLAKGEKTRAKAEFENALSRHPSRQDELKLKLALKSIGG